MIYMLNKIFNKKGEKKMKKVIFGVLVMLLLVSCSKDGENSIVEPNSERALYSENCTLIFFYDKEIDAKYYMQSVRGEGLNPYNFVNDSCLGYYDITGTRTITKYDSLKLFKNDNVFKFVIAYCSDKIDTLYFDDNERFDYITHTTPEMSK